MSNVRCEDEERNSPYLEVRTYRLQTAYSYSGPSSGSGPSGGVPAPDVSNKEKKTTREWSSSAPVWRTAARGLSLEGKQQLLNLIKSILEVLLIVFFFSSLLL